MKALIPWLLGVCVALADETAVTHRVTGMFSPDREADLREAVGKVADVKLVRIDFENAEAVFSYDLAVAFKGTKPENVVGRLNELVRNASNSTLGIVPVEPTPKGELKRVEIGVAGLDCKACALAAYESFYKIDGVVAATVNFKEGRVVALIDGKKTDQAALESALKKRGVEIETQKR